MNSCYRCDKTCVTPQYVCRSDYPVTEKARKTLKIKTDVTSVRDKKIQTCNICTSPDSRVALHDKNLFTRYETQFINKILIGLPMGIITEANTVNNDKTRYDLLLSNGKTEKEADTVLLIEIDEKQHFDQKGWIDGKLREAVFKKKYGISKKFIIRIRVSEDGKLDDGEKSKACVGKSGKNVCVVNTSLFDKNLKIVKDYISQVFSKKKPKISESYINFSDNFGLKDLQKLDITIAKTKNLEELKTLWDSRIKEQKTAKNKSYITSKEVQSVIKAYS
jgi:hypothetical protein